MPKVVCLDTQILIWGIQGTASKGQEDMIDRAKLLLQLLNKEKAQIVVPTIVISEFLVKLPDDTQEVVSSLMDRGFQVAPFDTPASLQFARIWKSNAVSDVKKELIDGIRLSRQELKADIIVLATAIIRRAECIYSADRRHMQRFAQGFIPVYDLRTISLLGPLFDLPPDPPPLPTPAVLPPDTATTK